MMTMLRDGEENSLRRDRLSESDARQVESDTQGRKDGAGQSVVVGGRNGKKTIRGSERELFDVFRYFEPTTRPKEAGQAANECKARFSNSGWTRPTRVEEEAQLSLLTDRAAESCVVVGELLQAGTETIGAPCGQKKNIVGRKGISIDRGWVRGCCPYSTRRRREDCWLFGEVRFGDDAKGKENENRYEEKEHEQQQRGRVPDDGGPLLSVCTMQHVCVSAVRTRVR